MGTMTDVSSKAQNSAGDARQKAFERLRELLGLRALNSGSHEMWFWDRLDSDWIYTMRLRLQDGRWVVAELKVFPDSELLNTARMNHWIAEPLDFVSEIPMGGLTARQLRRIAFGKPITMMGGLMKASKRIARRYRKSGDKDQDLAGIAEVYVACLRGGSRRPTADCAQQLRLPLSRVRDAIHQARTRELLTGSPGGQGFAGGELTPYALTLLQRKVSIKPRRKK